MWPLAKGYPGKVFFELEQPGEASRWNTLRALRVLRWNNRLATSRRKNQHSVEIISYSNLKIVYHKIEMRAVFNSLMAALVVVALFWGNCFSCPQVLLAAQKRRCCPHGKSDPSDCQTQGLRNFVKAEKAAPAAPAPVSTVAIAPPPATSCLSVAPVVPACPKYTPPDLLSLRI